MAAVGGFLAAGNACIVPRAFRQLQPGRIFAKQGGNAPLRHRWRDAGSPYRGAFGGLPLAKPPLQGAAESSAACGGESETEQVQRSQSTSVLQHAPCDAGTANRTVNAPQAAEGCGTMPRLYLHGAAVPAPSRKPFGRRYAVRRAKSPALQCKANGRRNRELCLCG